MLIIGPIMITKKRKIGNLGEGIACRYIRKKGFDIIGRNYLRKCGEIDIIAKKEGELHFIEVKTVSREIPPHSTRDASRETAGYRPEDNLHKSKLERISKTIQLYLSEKKFPISCDWSFHVVTVFLDFKKRIARAHMLKDIIL